MARATVDKFGELVITNFCDRAIGFYEKAVANKWQGKAHLQADIAKLTLEQREVVRRCVVQSVDNGLHDFLFVIGEASDPIQVL